MSLTFLGADYSRIAYTLEGSILIPLDIIIILRYFTSYLKNLLLKISIGSP